jgi:hypothetical protein
MRLRHQWDQKDQECGGIASIVEDKGQETPRNRVSKDCFRIQGSRQYLCLVKFDPTTLLVNVFCKDRHMDFVPCLVMVYTAGSHVYSLLAKRMSMGSFIGIKRYTTSFLTLGAKRCRPTLHPSILRNSSNSRTRRLQHRYP